MAWISDYEQTGSPKLQMEKNVDSFMKANQGGDTSGSKTSAQILQSSEVQLTQKACNGLNQFVCYLRVPIVAEGLKMISAPFILNMSQFRGWWRP